ncbi:MAG: ribonuclease R family protein [Thermoguttaceae bacterium]
MQTDLNLVAQLQQGILEMVQSPHYRPSKPKELARRLRLSDDDRPVLRRLLKKMVAKGQLTYGKSHLLYPGSQLERVSPQTAFRQSESESESESNLPLSSQSIAGTVWSKSEERLFQRQTARIGEKGVVDEENVDEEEGTFAKGEKPVGKKSKKRENDKRDEKMKERNRERDRAGESSKDIIGTLRTTRSGTCFVRPRDLNPELDPLEQDIMIFRRGTLDAIEGDIVLVELLGRHVRHLDGDLGLDCHLDIDKKKGHKHLSDRQERRQRRKEEREERWSSRAELGERGHVGRQEHREGWDNRDNRGGQNRQEPGRVGSVDRPNRSDSKRRESGVQSPRLRGRIIKIIERRTERFVGTFYQKKSWGNGSACVQVDGHLFSEPVEVNDFSGLTLQHKDKVVIEMVRFPRPDHPGEAVVVETLGPRGTPGQETQLIIREFNLPNRFTEEALHAAREEGHVFFEQLPDEIDFHDSTTSSRTSLTAGSKHVHSIEEGRLENKKGDKTSIVTFLQSQGRADFTSMNTVTIDPPDARDYDDAVSLERLANGNWLLHVHIADVSHFVKEHSPIDLDAKSRSTSVYLPDCVIPMLPEILSNALASLQPGKIRFTKTVSMEFTPTGIRCNTNISRSAIRSNARLTYEEVQDWFEHCDTKNGERCCSDTLLDRPELTDLLGEMRELARILRQKRKERGALELDRPDVKIELDDEGRVCGAIAKFQTEANQLIEEFMLAANEAVAEFLAKHELPFLRRVHQSPSYRKIKAFTEFLQAVLPNQPLLDENVVDELLKNRFAIQEILETIKGTQVESAVQLALLRSMQQAIYTPEEEGHYALASPCYCHFTSPIRRYPDLTIHRLLDSCLQEKKGHLDFQVLRLLGEHCSDLERRAESAERECVKLKLISYLQERPGLKMSGLISGVIRAGLFVEGTDIPAEGFIPLETIQDDYYWFDREEQTLRGRRTGRTFRLGDTVHVQLERVDPNAREVQFRLIGKPS